LYSCDDFVVLTVKLLIYYFYSSSSVVAKVYPSIPEGAVGEQSLNELHQLVIEQQQNMNALRQQMERQKTEMMEGFQQLLVKSFKEQENVVARKAEKQRILLKSKLYVMWKISLNCTLYRTNNRENVEGEARE